MQTRIVLSLICALAVATLVAAQYTAVEIADDGGIIKLGSALDTTLYRFSANILRTDGGLQVGGTALVTGVLTASAGITANGAINANAVINANAGVSASASISVTGTGGLSASGSGGTLLSGSALFPLHVVGQTLLEGTTTTTGTISVNTPGTQGAVADLNLDKGQINAGGYIRSRAISVKLLHPSGTFPQSFPTAAGSLVSTTTVVQMITRDAGGSADGWETDKNGTSTSMWQGVEGTVASGFVLQNAVCAPNDLRGNPLRGIYLLTGHANFGGCNQYQSTQTQRVLGFVVRYAGDPTNYQLASQTVSGTYATNIHISDVTSLSTGDCVYLTVRHNCDGGAAMTLNPPMGDMFSGTSWTTDTHGYKASLSMTYIGSRTPTLLN